MTLKTRPEFMKPLLSLLVIDKRNESGEGVRKVAGLNSASREANISKPCP